MKETVQKITLPCSDDTIKKLRAGDIVYISGLLYTGRDAAHERLIQLINKDQALPIDLKNQGIYYVGPTPTKPGAIIGSAGPTSSYRMDKYTEPLLMTGLKVMIGKGERSSEYRNLLMKYQAVYLSAIGGTAAKITETIKKCDLIAYPELLSEAIYQLEVENFYAIVTYDIYGNDLFKENRIKFQKR